MSSIIRLTDIQSPSVTNGLHIDDTTGLVSTNVYGFDIALSPLGYTPTGKTKVVFTMSNSDQSFVVPSGKTYILVKCWGSGGGGGSRGPANAWNIGGFGGGGGFSRGIIPVTPGETLTIRVGRGGYASIFGPSAVSGPYGGGTATSTADYYTGYGGGYCGIFRGSTPLLMAGAGGGGGASNIANATTNGGAGGGSFGLRGEFSSTLNGFVPPEGGTQSAGGAGGTGFYSPGNGSAFQGGSVQGNAYGGGGGGGYFGGGAGNYNNTSTHTMSGGGGGSGYVGPTVIFGQSFPGKGIYPAGMDDSDYPSSTASTFTSIGFGAANPFNGGDSYLTLYY
jgi:hypothetical protein